MNWFRQFFKRQQRYSDFEDEIQQHLAEKVEALMVSGLSRKDAEYEARREFGNVTSIEESGREIWTWPKLERLLSDMAFAVRKLRRSPGFAVTAILTLALGIGANVVVFSVLNGLILRPINVPQPDNLFQISRGKTGGDAQSYPDYRDYRDRDSSFSGILAYSIVRAGLTVDRSAIRSWGYSASGNYFDVLGVQPALGRFFHSSDEHGLGSAPYIVLSYDFWRSQFQSNPQVLGKTVQLNHRPFTVIGVAREDFIGTAVFFWPDYWIPLTNAAQVTGWDDFCCRDHLGLNVLGRLKPGVTPQQATESLHALTLQMAKEDRKDDGLSLRLRPPGLAGDKSDPSKNALFGIMLLAVLILLAACANLANIFAARAADRSDELAIRLAIGASRWIVFRQLLIEAVVVSITGGFLGSFIATLLLGTLSRLQPFGDFPTRLLIAPDAHVYVVALLLSIASGVFFGLLPARQICQTDIVQAIKSGYVFAVSFRNFALRDLLLATQIVVCTLLLTASLLAVRGMVQALHVPLAIQPQNATLAQVDLRMAGHTGEQALPMQKRLLEAASAIPGVTAVTVADSIPFIGGGDWFVYRWGTTDFLPSHMAFAASTFLIAPGYLQTAGTRLQVGRDFTWGDDGNSPGVAIVNETFARRLFGDTQAVGRRFALWATAKYEIVGIVEDGKYSRVGEDPQPAMFLPLAQGVGKQVKSASTILVVRTKLPPDQITAELHRTLTNIEPGAPFTIRPWADAIDRSMMPARTATVVLGVMGLMAAMLAVTGIFGMASYSVSKRTKEQGIRMALGAQQIQVMRSMLSRPILLLLSGSCIGLIAGLLTAHVLAHLISFASPRDPVVLFGVLSTMMLLGLLATWIPARRALAVDPARLLRQL
ncbi:MAG TPA: ABC transporter permease [Edaphobacter sp.]|nr:ABC transporter permease [Edaphobacter sp.]